MGVIKLVAIIRGLIIITLGDFYLVGLSLNHNTKR